VTTPAKPPREWKHESVVFLLHIAALLRPGTKVPVFQAHRIEPNDVSAWIDEELNLVIEEGRRQLDQQVLDLDRIRGRAQFMLTTALALSGGLFASAKPLVTDGLGTFTLWIGAVTMSTLAVLGAASLMTTRSEFSVIDTALLTHQTPPITGALAAAYSRAVRVGANTVATRLTLYRDGAFCLLIGAALFAGAWLSHLPV
jgi:hypothetical protein